MPKLNEPNTSFLNRLRELLGQAGWLDPEERYLTERRGLFRGRAALIARPASTSEVAACVRLCAEARIGIVPWGGGTGLVGGQVKSDGPTCIVLALDRMRNVRRISPDENAVLVEAGATLQSVQDAAAEADRLFPLSYASEGSATIGGALAVNSGGLQALRYGVARDLCLGLEIVTPQGEVWNGLSTLRKDNTGYDLRDLYIGSEGTLGIITAASLKLFPKPTAKAAAFVAIRDVDAALNLLRRAQARSDSAVSVAEIMPQLGIDFVLQAHPEMRAPLSERADWYFYTELWGSDQAALDAALEDSLADAYQANEVLDAAIAASEAQRLSFRAIREALSDAQGRSGGASIKHDVSVPIGTIAEFLSRAGETVSKIIPGARPCPFGHLGDGNIHYNVSQPIDANHDEFLGRWEELNAAIHDVVIEMGGSISAEHGIGRLKCAALHETADSVKLRLMAQVKSALDPMGLMNPGALFGGRLE